MNKIKIVILFLALFTLSEYRIAIAQVDGDAKPQDDLSVITAFSASEIAKETENINAILQNSQNLLIPVSEITDIQKQLPDILAKVKEIQVLADEKNLTGLKDPEITDLAQKCIIHETRFSEWQNLIKDRISIFENEQVLLDKYLNAWQETNRISKAEKFPAEVVTSIKYVISAIRKQSTDIKSELNELLKIQNGISKQEILLSEIQARLENIQKESREGLFSIDSDPLWKIFSKSDEQPKLRSQYSMLSNRHGSALTDFYQIYGNRIPYHLITLIAFMILFILLKKFSNKLVLEEDKTHILSHPFAAAIMITLFLTALYYPRAPNIVNVLSASLIIIPIAILLPKNFKPRMRSIIYFFIAIHLLQQLHLLAIENTLFQRLALLLITLLVIIGISLFLRSPKESVLSSDNRMSIAFRTLMYPTLAMLVISVFSNIIGNLSLADQITKGVMKSIYAALGIVVVVQILVGLFTTIIYSETSGRLLLIREQKKVIRKYFIRSLYIIAFLLWAKIVLQSFNTFQPFQEWYLAVFSARWEVGSMNISLGDVVAFIVTIIFSVWLSKFIRFILEGDILPRISLPRGVPGTISMLTNYIILGFGFIIAFSAAGIDMSKFALLAGALGVGIGFGLQNIVNNFISGLILIFERPIQIGDVIELSELRGTVNRIGIRSSTIRTFSGAEVIVPNANLISNEVVNWTLSDKMRRIEIPVGVAYGSDPNQVLGILKTLARNHEGVLKVPEPFVLFRGFGDSSLDFELRFWTGDFNTWMELQTQVTLLVHDALKGAGIEIPFPQRDLHIKSSDMLQKFVKPVSSTEDQDNLSEKKNAPEKDPASEA